jgi:dUTP pyrophosphatase
MEGSGPIKVQYTRSSEVPILQPAYPNDAGVDLTCIEDVVINPLNTVRVHTGVYLALPPNTWGLIIGRSSTRGYHLHVHHGVIDSGFRGEMLIFVTNNGMAKQHIEKGKRLAQLIVIPKPTVVWEEVEELPEGERGTRGFGSTG